MLETIEIKKEPKRNQTAAVHYVRDEIAKALRDPKVGITAQARSSQLKVDEMLDAQDSLMNKPIRVVAKRSGS
ncbi:hypothetical protein RvY_08529 [Ramazzottius varieornatus]|uniref:Uncharacterized protein n=1 Tax=Ramazzottius varieornatus TaxID=947166 RepID=A0A1D1VBR5_RAMVA|nr:hypothetical protein RvY_08529 [Ramazzottius varieornatus]